jgi:hypothetical protein
MNSGGWARRFLLANPRRADCCNDIKTSKIGQYRALPNSTFRSDARVGMFEVLFACLRAACYPAQVDSVGSAPMGDGAGPSYISNRAISCILLNLLFSHNPPAHFWDRALPKVSVAQQVPCDNEGIRDDHRLFCSCPFTGCGYSAVAGSAQHYCGRIRPHPGSSWPRTFAYRTGHLLGHVVRTLLLQVQPSPPQTFTHQERPCCPGPRGERRNY